MKVGVAQGLGEKTLLSAMCRGQSVSTSSMKLPPVTCIDDVTLANSVLKLHFPCDILSDHELRSCLKHIKRWYSVVKEEKTRDERHVLLFLLRENTDHLIERGTFF